MLPGDTWQFLEITFGCHRTVPTTVIQRKMSTVLRLQNPVLDFVRKHMLFMETLENIDKLRDKKLLATVNPLVF